MKFINVGFPVYLFMGLMYYFIMGTYTTKNIIIFLLLIYGAAFLGNIVRIVGKPDSYMYAGGAWEGFKAKFYWRYGPQLLGAIVLAFYLYVFQVLVIFK